MNSLTILSVGYPFARVTEDPAGGAEQILAHLDRALVADGHRSIVLAPEGSRVAGELLPLPAGEGPIDDAAKAATQAEAAAMLNDLLAQQQVDLIHYHGVDFATYRTDTALPQLVTLHLPLAWYPHAALSPDLHLLPVSDNQAATAPPGVELLSPIPNGVDLDLYRAAGDKGDYALVMGRMAPEKGFHDAIAAAKAAGVPLVIAGALYPYPAHQAYFEETVAPALDAERRWIGAVTGAAKRRLIAEARCLLVPSTAPETSSLVAMEALASGTPVIAYRAGALPDVVEDGITGFIVDDVAAMADAIGRVEAIDPAACRRAAELRFDARRMCAAYLDLYRRLAA